MQDSKQIDELFRLMDDVCENGDAALPALEQYLQTQTDAPEIDTEASLKKFKADHREFFVKPHRGRRLCHRLLPRLRQGRQPHPLMQAALGVSCFD